jgi:aryl-alcohol dehydrogenase
MSRLVLAHENGAVKVEATREEMKALAALGCGIQTGAGSILNVLNPSIHSTIAVFGAGAVGLSACMIAKLYSPSKLILLDNSPAKLSNLPPSHGATHLIDSSTLTAQGAVAAKLMELTDGEGVEYVIDAVGLPLILKEGHAGMAKGGTLVTLGGVMKECSIVINDHLVKGGNWRGTHQGDSVPRVMIPKMIGLWREGESCF